MNDDVQRVFKGLNIAQGGHYADRKDAIVAAVHALRDSDEYVERKKAS
jgi:hypothetical protein